MKYMLLMYGAEGNWSDAEREACMAESLRVCDELATRGKFLDAAPLLPVATATTVRRSDGRHLVTAGPFAETVEQLGGYFVLELDDLDEAIAVAARLPSAHLGTAEIRPLQTLDGLPPPKPHTVEGGKPPYLLLIYHDADRPAMTEAELQAGAATAAAVAGDLAAAGKYISAAPLHPAETATCVRVRDGQRVITDGPFAETHEVLGGYYLVRADTREEAVGVAARLTGLCGRTVEVRQLFDLTPVRAALAVS